MISDPGDEHGLIRVVDFSEYCGGNFGRTQRARVHASDTNSARAKAHGMVVVHAPGFLREQDRGTSQFSYLHADLQTIIEFRWRMVIDGRAFYYKHAPGFTR